MSQRINYLCLILITGLVACRGLTTTKKVEASQYVFNDSINSTIDSGIWRLSDPYRVQLNKEMNDTLAYSAQVMMKGTPEGLLGNFAADACVSTSIKLTSSNGEKADFAVFNNGGLRTSLPAGTILLSNIYELMPFENELVILTLDGTITGMLLNYIASIGGAPVSGIRLELKNKKIENAEIGGVKFDSTATYTVLTSDYLANGGDNMQFLLQAKKKEFLNIKVRDAMIEYLHDLRKKGDTLVVRKDGRIRNL